MRIHTTTWVCLFVGLTLGLSTARADLFYLNNGGQIEGQFRGETDTHYQVRSYVGLIEIAKADVNRREPATSVFDEYDRRKAFNSNTPDGLVELANWCNKHGLQLEQRQHLDQALKLNPNHAGARAALGYTRVGDLWVESKTVVQSDLSRRRAARRAKIEAQREFAARYASLEQTVRSLDGRYFIGRAEERHIGYAKLEALVAQDSLALEAIFNVMTRSRHEIFREAVLDLFTGTQGLEATEYLAVMALEDRSAAIRANASESLLKRDPLVVIQILLRALSEPSAAIQNRAVDLLAKLDAQESIPKLISLLVGERKKWVESSVEDQLIDTRYAYGTFYGPCMQVTTLVNESPVFTYRSEFRRENVPVYRNTVRDALVKLTGQDFGFDQAAWATWYEGTSTK
jgi:hypothetical protein